MSADQNKAIARRILQDVVGNGNLDGVEQVMAVDVVDHTPQPGFDGAGIGEFKSVITMLRAAFPDLSVTIEHMIAEGDKVAQRWTLRGTNKGEFAGIPPTGKQISVGVIEILHFADGKVVERWGQVDNMGMLQQLGVIPAPGQ
ncbi:MAG: ester cyclase [Chloroflexota bacterium]|nr:ester cyclase [Chloroflexota bacterium]